MAFTTVFGFNVNPRQKLLIYFQIFNELLFILVYYCLQIQARYFWSRHNHFESESHASPTFTATILCWFFSWKSSGGSSSTLPRIQTKTIWYDIINKLVQRSTKIFQRAVVFLGWYKSHWNKNDLPFCYFVGLRMQRKVSCEVFHVCSNCEKFSSVLTVFPSTETWPRILDTRNPDKFLVFDSY